MAVHAPAGPEKRLVRRGWLDPDDVACLPQPPGLRLSCPIRRPCLFRSPARPGKGSRRAWPRHDNVPRAYVSGARAGRDAATGLVIAKRFPPRTRATSGSYPRDSDSVVGRLLELEESRLPCPVQRRPAPRREITQHAPSCLGKFRKIVEQGRPSRALRRVWWGSREGEWSCDEIRRGSMGPSRCLVRAVLFTQTRLNFPRGAPAEREVHGA